MQSVGYIKTQLEHLGFGMQSFAHWGAACPSNIQPACFPAQRLSSSKGGSGGSIIQEVQQPAAQEGLQQGKIVFIGETTGHNLRYLHGH